MALTTPASKPADTRPPSPLRRVVEFCSRPQPALDALDRRRSRILAAFLLVSIAVFGFVDSVYVLTVPGYVPPWYGYVLLVGAWLLNRRGRYGAAATVTLALFPLVIFSRASFSHGAEWLSSRWSAWPPPPHSGQGPGVGPARSRAWA